MHVGAVVDTWACFPIGVLGWMGYFGISRLMLRIEVDDPVDAVAVHGGGGVVGMICTGLFANEKYVQAYGKSKYGAFMGGGGSLLATQLIASLCIILWSAGIVAGFLYILKVAGCALKEDVAAELLGLDFKYFDGTSPNLLCLSICYVINSDGV